MTPQLGVATRGSGYAVNRGNGCKLQPLTSQLACYLTIVAADEKTHPLFRGCFVFSQKMTWTRSTTVGRCGPQLNPPESRSLIDTHGGYLNTQHSGTPRLHSAASQCLSLAHFRLKTGGDVTNNAALNLLKVKKSHRNHLLPAYLTVAPGFFDS